MTEHYDCIEYSPMKKFDLNFEMHWFFRIAVGLSMLHKFYIILTPMVFNCLGF